jgi:hypothetical protein
VGVDVNQNGAVLVFLLLFIVLLLVADRGRRK